MVSCPQMATSRRSQSHSKPAEPASDTSREEETQQGRLERIAGLLTSWQGLLISCVLALGLGASVGFAMVYIPDPSAVRELERYQPSIHSIIYDDAGDAFDEWVIERRQMVAFKDIPRHLHERAGARRLQDGVGQRLAGPPRTGR